MGTGPLVAIHDRFRGDNYAQTLLNNIPQVKADLNVRVPPLLRIVLVYTLLPNGQTGPEPKGPGFTHIVPRFKYNREYVVYSEDQSRQ